MVLRNFAIKFAILLGRFHRNVVPKLFLDLTPSECLTYFLQELPDPIRQRLYFSYPDHALLDMIDTEFEVDMERNKLVFRKPLLDAESIRIAQGVRKTLGVTEDLMIQSLAGWMFDATRGLYRKDIGSDRVRDIQEEYGHYFRLFSEKFGPEDGDRLIALMAERRSEDRQSWLRFTNAMTADAVYKTDGAQALFGEESAYALAWQRKELFRHRMSQVIERFILSHAA